MNITGPIIIIEDDLDDHELFLTAYNNLGYTNELLFFADGHKALDFLNNTNITPFIIISDINMPKLDGFELRDKIRTDINLQNKCIPYLFFSTASSQQAVVKAYSLSVQGFFVKKDKIADIQKTISVIIEYWKSCVAPNSFM
jgi:CheY-like chemotaxis protein